MNYAALRQAVLDYTANTDTTFDSNIDNFIKAAERRIYATLDLPAKGLEATSAMTAGNRFLTMPTAFLAVEGVMRRGVGGTGSHEYLLQKDVSFIRECWPDPATTGAPRVFALFDENTLMLGPTPDLAYGVELHYSAWPESIVTASTTWLGDNYEFVLLYGALVEAYTFMKGDEDMLKQYASLLADGVGSLRKYLDSTKVDLFRGGQPQGAPA